MHVQGYKAQGEAQAFESALQVQLAVVPGIQKRTWENEIQDVAFPAIFSHYGGKRSIAYGRSPKADALQGRGTACEALQQAQSAQQCNSPSKGVPCSSDAQCAA